MSLLYHAHIHKTASFHTGGLYNLANTRDYCALNYKTLQMQLLVVPD